MATSHYAESTPSYTLSDKNAPPFVN